MHRVAEDLAERLATVDRRFERAATLFCVTGDAKAVLHESGKVGDVLRVEADDAFLGAREGVTARPETIPLQAASLDLAVSLLALQETNDTPGIFAQIRRALKPDGLFLGAMAGSGTLAELRESMLQAEAEISGGATPHVHPF